MPWEGGVLTSHSHDSTGISTTTPLFNAKLVFLAPKSAYIDVIAAYKIQNTPRTWEIQCFGGICCELRVKTPPTGSDKFELT